MRGLHKIHIPTIEEFEEGRKHQEEVRRLSAKLKCKPEEIPEKIAGIQEKIDTLWEDIEKLKEMLDV